MQNTQGEYGNVCVTRVGEDLLPNLMKGARVANTSPALAATELEAARRRTRAAEDELGRL